jgi:hypothetical protein
MTKEFIDTLTQYNNQFISSDNPMSFMELITFDSMLNFMKLAINENEPLDFEYIIERDEIIPDNIVVKIGDKIIN